MKMYDYNSWFKFLKLFCAVCMSSWTFQITGEIISWLAMVEIYLSATLSMWEAPQVGRVKGRKGRGKDAWFWLGFICSTLPPVHMHYHGDFKGDEPFCYLQDFCFMQRTRSTERCSEKISTALFVVISASWHQEHLNAIVAAVGSCGSSGSNLISDPNFFVILNKSCWVSHLLRGRQQYSSTSQWQVELNSILLQASICLQLKSCKRK